MMKKDSVTRHDENLNGLSRIEGQVRGVKGMIQEGAYCVDIINQIQAARAALQTVSRRILEKHMSHCVLDSMESSHRADARRKIDEIMTLIKVFDRCK